MTRYVCYPTIQFVNHDYLQSHSGFESPWQHVIAFKSFNSKAQWFKNQAQLNVRFRTDATPTVTGDLPFQYFDTATMNSYKYPSRARETVFCRLVPDDDECLDRGFDPNLPNVNMQSSIEVRKGSTSSHGLSTFATTDIPAISYLGLEEYVQRIHVGPWSFHHIQSMLNTQFASHHAGRVLHELCLQLGRQSSDHVSQKWTNAGFRG